jgi:hypothetical protein
MAFLELIESRDVIAQPIPLGRRRCLILQFVLEPLLRVS